MFGRDREALKGLRGQTRIDGNVFREAEKRKTRGGKRPHPGKDEEGQKEESGGPGLRGSGSPSHLSIPPGSWAQVTLCPGQKPVTAV